MGTLYSHSRLEAFRQCPFKFRCAYIDRLEPAFTDTIESFMGSRVHDTLEKLYKDLHFEYENTLQELLDFYHQQWEEKFSDDIVVVKGYSAERYRELGERFIRDYYERFRPFNHDRTIGIENRIIVDLGEGYQLQGYIDRLADEGDGVYVVHDYKTSNTLKTQREAEEDMQLALYALGVKQQYQDCRTVKLVWHMLAFDKDVSITTTDEQLEEVRTRALQRIKEIEAARSFPAQKSALCGWCEYRPYCPHFKHIHQFEKLLDNPHQHDEGVELARKYNELNQQKQQIDKQMRELREAIFAYSNREGVSCLTDGTHRIRVWSKECIKIPHKTDPLYDELKKMLKGMGRFEEVEAIDQWKLSKLLEQKEWPEELRQMLEGFTHSEEVRRLYPSS